MPYYQRWKPYVPVGHRQAGARREMENLRKKGVAIAPVERIQGRKIASTFWGEAWCGHLEKFSDYANRLPRGRSYVRNGSVCHLGIDKGKIHAYVSGSDLYEVEITIKPMPKGKWDYIRKSCTGQIGSLLELLQGRFSKEVMAVVTDRDDGLFPLPGEITFSCSCPDWAVMCKHVAAVLYGVGARLDTAPAMLFQLRGLDHEELLSGEAIAAATAATQVSTARRRIKGNLTEVFGFDMNGTGENAAGPDAEAAPGLPSKDAAGESPATRPKRKRAKGDVVVTDGERAASPKDKRKAPPAVSFDEKTSAFLDSLNGDKLQAVLDAAGVGVDLFAKTIGVSRMTVRNWLGQGSAPIRMYNKSRRCFEGILTPSPTKARGGTKDESLRARIAKALKTVVAGERTASPPKETRSGKGKADTAKAAASRASGHRTSKPKSESGKQVREAGARKASGAHRTKKGTSATDKTRHPAKKASPTRKTKAAAVSRKPQAPRKRLPAQMKEVKPVMGKRASSKSRAKQIHELPVVWTGSQVAALRKRLGLGVGAFAQELGVTPQSVYGWEKKKGALALRSDSVAALAALAGK